MDILETTPAIPTWGYKPCGEARIFELAPGEGLPEGWDPSPDVITDPAKATAEALTDRAAGRPYLAPQVNAVDMIPAAASPDTAMAEIERLKGIIAAGSQENESLVEEIDRAEGVLAAAAAEIATLKAALAKAEADGADVVTAHAEARATIERLSGELAEARKDLEGATTPNTAAKAK